MLLFLVPCIFTCLENLLSLSPNINDNTHVDHYTNKKSNYKIPNLAICKFFFHLNLIGIGILDSEGFHGFMFRVIYVTNTSWDGYICQGYCFSLSPLSLL
jgi:hypothetical protein